MGSTRRSIGLGALPLLAGLGAGCVAPAAPAPPIVRNTSPAVPPVPPVPAIQEPLAPFVVERRGPPDISAAAALVIDASSGEVLLERAAGERRPMASTTKIMTAMVVLDRVPEDQLDIPFTVSHMRPRLGETLMGLRSGERTTIRELLYGLLLASGNDAADALALRVAGSAERFVTLMNARAAELGLADTRFANPSGLDQERHYASARDLAALARHAMREYPALAKIAGERVYTAAEYGTGGAGGTGSEPAGRKLVNQNMALHIYPGVTGMKPGWTPKAGTCQVVSATLFGRSVVAVLLDTSPAAAEMVQLLDWVYGTSSILVPPEHDLTFVRGIAPDGQPWVFFAATREQAGGAFARAYERLGGMEALGYPVGAERREHGRRVQYFQRARLEHRAEAAGTTGEVSATALEDGLSAMLLASGS